MHTYIHAYIQSHTHKLTYIHTYIHTYTCIQIICHILYVMCSTSTTHNFLLSCLLAPTLSYPILISSQCPILVLLSYPSRFVLSSPCIIMSCLFTLTLSCPILTISYFYRYPCPVLSFLVFTLHYLHLPKPTLSLSLSLPCLVLSSSGGIVTVLVGNTRKAMTICLSFLLFPKPMSWLYAAGDFT